MADALKEQIEAFLSARPSGAMIDELARGLRVRPHTLRQILNSDERFQRRSRGAFPSDRAQVWLVPSEARDGTGRALPGPLKSGSQCWRLLEILEDGKWHSSRELIFRVPCVLHSRIVELRERGERLGTFRIEHRGEGGGAENHEYRYIEVRKEARAA